MGRDRHGRAGASEGDVERGEVGGDGAGAGGGDNRGLRLLEEPLNGFAVGFVTQFAGQLEDAGGAESRHSDAPPPSVHLCVAVLR